jgi:hypothetical protein
MFQILVFGFLNPERLGRLDDLVGYLAGDRRVVANSTLKEPVPLVMDRRSME